MPYVSQTPADVIKFFYCSKSSEMAKDHLNSYRVSRAMASTPASMLKIVSSGLEDIERLNAVEGQPSLSFYKTVIRQHTRWASQWRRVEFDNIADFGRTATVTLPILGELITRAILVVVLPDIVKPQEDALTAALNQFKPPEEHKLSFLSTRCTRSPHRARLAKRPQKYRIQTMKTPTSVYPAWSWTNSIGHALCTNMNMLIGNQVIDTLDSRLMEVIDEQSAPFDHFDTTNFKIARDPCTFNPLLYNSSAKLRAQVKTVVQSPQTVQIVPPFWWNRGPGPQTLPIQALAKDKVQITCTFRPLQDCVYTDYRVGFNPPLSANEGVGPLPNIAGSVFYTPVIPSVQGAIPLKQYGRDPVSGSALPDISASLVNGVRMPTDYHFIDAYWIVEYVSLEDKEAAAWRQADLQIPIEQHVALPVTPTNGSMRTRIDIEAGGLVRDMSWVAQRVEASSYNAHFLFSRDLAPQDAAPSEIPWWPNARFPSWDLVMDISIPVSVIHGQILYYLLLFF